MVNFGDALRKGLRFSVEPKRWLPLLVLDAAVLTTFLYFLLGRMDQLISLVSGLDQGPTAFAGPAGLIRGFLLLGAAWYVLRLWILGSLVHQSYRPREGRRAYEVSLSRMPKLLVSVILVSIIAGLAGLVPLVGWLLSLIIGWMFFFVFQGVILDDLGAVSTLKNSYRIFRKSPLDVFLIWLVITLVTLAIAGVFALPLIAVFFGIVMNAVISAGAPQSPSFAVMLMQVQSNLAQVIALGFVALVGFEISQVFAIKAQTEFYLQLRKRFPSIIKGFLKAAGRFF